MRRYVVLILLAACSKPSIEPAAPGTSFGYRQPSDGGGSTSWGSADGMPIGLRSKFEPLSGEAYVSWVPAEQDPDSGLVEIGAEDFQLLDEELAAMASTGTLHAKAELDAGLFTLRRTVEGQSEDILAAWVPGAGRLAWITDLAWAMDDDERSERHDAWVTDVDGDDRPEIVQRSTTTAGQGEEVTWAAWSISTGLDLVEIDLPGSLRNRLASTNPSRKTVARAGS